MRIFKTTLVILTLLIIGLIILQCRIVGDVAPSPDEVPGFIPQEFPTNMPPHGEGLSSNSVSGIHDFYVDQKEIAAVVTLKDIPDGEFKNQVQNLPAQIQKEVLEKIRKSPQLLNDIDSIRLVAEGVGEK